MDALHAQAGKEFNRQTLYSGWPKDIKVPVSMIQEILNNRRKPSMDTALRLSHYFGASDEYFINLQMRIDLEAEKLAIKKEIDSLPTYKESRCG